MSNYTQRIRDWIDYRREFKYDIMVSKIGMTIFMTRSVFWFLLQSPEKRMVREEQEILALEKILDIVMVVLALVGTGPLIYSMFEPIKLWIPLLVINAGAWMGIIRLFLKHRRESGK